VRAAYGISWAYLIGDVGNEGYKAYRQNQRIRHPNLPRTALQERYNNATQPLPGDNEGEVKPGVVPPLEDYRTVIAQRAIFQGIASMGLPAFTIHSIVRYSGRAMKDIKNVKIRTWGPIGLGLAAVPFLPYLFDQPVESAVEWTFHKGFETFGGSEAVGNAPSTGRERQLEAKPLHEKKKEKEL
jgi:fission process protein 1